MAYARSKPTASFEGFADKIDVAPETLYDWARSYPEFRAAKDKAKRIMESQLCEVGFKGMTGKLKAFHQAAWIFWMKARFGWKEDGPSDLEETELEFVD